MPSAPAVSAAIARLRSPETVRGQCLRILDAAHREELPHFRLYPERLELAVDWVVESVRERYPSLEIPYHSRWRHFDVGGLDRWGALMGRSADLPSEELARVRFDLAVTSVLLDAGAGDRWSFVDPVDGRSYARSEGLAVASFAMFQGGLFSATEGRPWRADADALEALEPERLASHLQVSSSNPLVGLDGRCELLRRLGAALRTHPDLFGLKQPRVGNLFDALLDESMDGELSATAILSALLVGLAEVWPDGYRFHDTNVGDVGYHSALEDGGEITGLVPFHKLSQWLAYSLVEPLQEYGIVVTGLDALTALAEYRNGGLLVDTGVLVLRDAGASTRSHAPDSETVVEWRALTVALIDEIAEAVRTRLSREPEELPLAAVLEGGTWWAGRKLASTLRKHGGPPLQVASAATIF